MTRWIKNCYGRYFMKYSLRDAVIDTYGNKINILFTKFRDSFMIPIQDYIQSKSHDRK